MALVYFMLGVLFTFVAIQSVDETVWNPLTIILLLVAAMDFFVAFRFLKKSLRKKER